MKRGDQSAEVLQLQRDLLELGYALPRWGADGDLGTETLGALGLFLQSHGTGRDDDTDTVSDEELALVSAALTAQRNGTAGPEGVVFHDRRDTASSQHVYGRRAWTGITGITLHQTACVLGERPSRWDTIGAHIGITRKGLVIQLHDFDELVVHGNGWNTACVGIEMDGTYAGVKDDLGTFWRPKEHPERMPQTPTPELIEAARSAVRFVCREVARRGGHVKKLVAHRQASKDRESDPGSELWQAVAIPMHAELGLDAGTMGFTIGTGLAIPEAWDPRCVGIKYR